MRLGRTNKIAVLLIFELDRHANQFRASKPPFAKSVETRYHVLCGKSTPGAGLGAVLGGDEPVCHGVNEGCLD